ncbi:MAG: Holliday junction branch migration protein RuvA [Rhodomicrobium sp.]|nr:Holliday junction branch migration protein RuvA [Rhodomicrobium sp.]
MIGKLRGLVDGIGKDWVIVDVGGVGYEVSCPARTLSRLPAIGQPVTLIVETHVREDAIKLFGFLSEGERSWFRLLQNVQGVGTKVALSVLGVLEPHELANAIALQDKAQVGRAPGVGPKVAQRIVSELRDKAPGLLAAGDIGPKIAGQPVGGKASPIADAVSALVNLGYSAADAHMAVTTVAGLLGEGAKTEELIRQGLKELAK